MVISLLPYVGMIIVQCAQVGLIILSKQAMSSGMTNFSFIFYSNALASLILLPSSFFFHRRSTRPPITFLFLCRVFLLGVLGCTSQIAGFAGISYTSASFTSAIVNFWSREIMKSYFSILGFRWMFTPHLALLCLLRMEKVGYTLSTTAKSVGTVVSIAGAFILVLYRGPQFLETSSSKSYFQYIQTQQTNWIVGGLLLTVDCVASSAYLIVQAVVVKHFPAELIVVFFYCFFAAVLSALISLFVEKDLSSWSLQPNVRLLAVLYSGAIGSALRISVTLWCVHRKGPVFVAMFHPLGIVISAVLGIIILHDALYMGSLLGSIIIVFGFYLVMWGKVKDTNLAQMNTMNIEKAPLLQIQGDETDALF